MNSKIANVARNGAFGDVIACSAVTSQLKALGYGVVFYTSCTEVAKILDGVDVVVNISMWQKRPEGRDINLIIYPLKDGYPKTPMKKHMTEYACENAGLPYGSSKLKSFDRIRDDEYITFQPKTGWSTYKEYSHWDSVLDHFKHRYPIVVIDESRDWKSSCSLIQHAAIHLGHDSVGNHIAGAYGTKAVILFGSTSPVGSGYKTATNLWKPCGIGPCYYEDKFSNGIKGVCLDKCIDTIDPEDVVNAISEKLNE